MTQKNKKIKRSKLLAELRAILENEAILNSDFNIRLPYDDSSFNNYVLKTNGKNFKNCRDYFNHVADEIFEFEKEYLSSRINKLFKEMQKKYETLFSFLDEKGLEMIKEDFEDIVSSHVVYDIFSVIKEEREKAGLIYEDIFKLPY